MDFLRIELFRISSQETFSNSRFHFIPNLITFFYAIWMDVLAIRTLQQSLFLRRTQIMEKLFHIFSWYFPVLALMWKICLHENNFSINTTNLRFFFSFWVSSDSLFFFEKYFFLHNSTDASEKTTRICIQFFLYSFFGRVIFFPHYT